jgi:hypothetical protein
LEPPQAALPNHAVPIDRRLRMAAEDVGRKDLPTDPFLAGVNDLGIRYDGGNLGDVFRFDGIAENNALGHGTRDCGF